MNQKREEKKANLKIRVGVLICVIALMLFFVSYGYFYISTNQSDRNRLTGGCFNPTFTDGSSISLTNAVPMTNEEGLKSTPYDFTLTNSCQTNVKYYVILNIKDGSMDPKNISVSYDGQTSFRLDTLGINTNESGKSEGYTTSYVLKQDMLNNGSKTEHIRLWLNDEADYNEMQSGSNTFTAEVKVVEGVGSFLGTDKILSLVKGADTSSTDVIEKPAPEGATCINTLAYDGTVDNNLRYVGANPCNYVSFNNELWRIIGVMNNVDDGTGKTETRIKLIRKDSLGSYSWDTSPSEVNSGYGINDWTGADLMYELNGDYLNTSLSSNQMWYNGQNNKREKLYNYENGLSSSSQMLISDALWNTTKINNIRSFNSGSIYQEEKNPTNGSDYSSWVGKIGLIYPSDYMFSIGGLDQERTNCLNSSVYGNSTNCANLNWLKSSENYWTIISGKYDSLPGSIITCYSVGHIDSSYYAYYNYQVWPTLYLKSSVQIMDGNGSEENPYTLE